MVPVTVWNRVCWAASLRAKVRVTRGSWVVPRLPRSYRASLEVQEASLHTCCQIEASTVRNLQGKGVGAATRETGSVGLIQRCCRESKRVRAPLRFASCNTYDTELANQDQEAPAAPQPARRAHIGDLQSAPMHQLPGVKQGSTPDLQRSPLLSSQICSAAGGTRV